MSLSKPLSSSLCHWLMAQAVIPFREEACKTWADEMCRMCGISLRERFPVQISIIHNFQASANSTYGHLEPIRMLFRHDAELNGSHCCKSRDELIALLRKLQAWGRLFAENPSKHPLLVE